MIFKKMAATDGQVIVAAARWYEEGLYLKEYIAKQKLPSVAKIIKGQYTGLGVPTLPSPGLQSTALIVTAGKVKKIIAQPVKIKEGRRIDAIGPRIVIPENYKGFFELLSEEGRAIRCMESVAEIARRKLEDGCLVRDNIRAIAAKVDTHGVASAEGVRNLAAGEVIIPKGEIQLNGCKGRYLKCVDTKGDAILLGLEQRGKFSAIAKEDNISGVHSAKTLLTKRLPVTVRLVHGLPPRNMKSSHHFVPELRLLSMIEEEHLFALPLQKEGNNLIYLPIAAPLKLQRCRNGEQISNFMEFSRLIEKCQRLVSDVIDKIHILDGKLGDRKRILSAQLSTPPVIKTGYFLRKSASCDTANQRPAKDENKVPDEYDEIDQIYAYVRGFAPLPKNIKNLFSSEPVIKHESAPSSPIQIPLLNDKPEPPPIETIPTKKLLSASKAEKRTRKTAIAAIKDPPAIVYKEKLAPVSPVNNLPKLYLKNNNVQKGRVVLRQKSFPISAEQSSSPITSPIRLSKEDSPLFNIRYKSLTNIQQAMEMDGTLDSSHSGGRTSGDSAGGPKLPEKRSRRISRPKSLTNLVWELRGCIPEPTYEKPKAKNKSDTKYRSGATNKLSIGSHKRALYL